MDRKSFIKLISSGAVCGGMLPFLEGCATYRYVNAIRNGTKLIVEKATFQKDPFVLIRNPQSKSPIYVRKNIDDTFAALLLECTHRQCTVNPTGATLSCPCHGSKFDSKGKVLGGPARRALWNYEVSTDSENIYIQLPKQTG